MYDYIACSYAKCERMFASEARKKNYQSRTPFQNLPTALTGIFEARLYLIGICSLAFKVVGKAQATKSNSHNFWYRCLVLALIDVSEVLAQTLHDRITYERKKNLKFV